MSLPLTDCCAILIATGSRSVYHRYLKFSRKDVIRYPGALLVTPCKLPIVNHWPTVNCLSDLVDLLRDTLNND